MTNHIVPSETSQVVKRLFPNRSRSIRAAANGATAETKCECAPWLSKMPAGYTLPGV